MTTPNLVPRADGEGGIGTALKKWATGFMKSLTLTSGAAVTEFSTDGSMFGNSDAAVPTEKAVRTFVLSIVCRDNQVVCRDNEVVTCR